MTKLVEHFTDYPMAGTDKHEYIRFRMGRLKHQMWLWNRKRKDAVIIDTHDHFVVRNLKPGATCVFGSAGYYLEDLIDDLTVVEQWDIVKKFYPKAIIVKDRNQLAAQTNRMFDNFVVINNRGDIWCDLATVKQHVTHYTSVMNPGCRFFYSFRDTQIVNWNRLKNDHHEYFYQFGKELEELGLNLIWYDIKFADKTPAGDGSYDMLENPDTTNGNIKFMFEYKTKETILK